MGSEMCIRDRYTVIVSKVVVVDFDVPVALVSIVLFEVSNRVSVLFDVLYFVVVEYIVVVAKLVIVLLEVAVALVSIVLNVVSYVVIVLRVVL